ncbi:molybdopterin-synthase adenylyltransferase MoeB [Acidipila sp. EB88]|uniref:molybdopterin-synthase adenylyltransferase MoeB n=1 Tax=Acidipila sp. EB88 TaxID=2305226 RepID=UPI000F5E21B4|nr:molybdopterin-synthase adenylyltransferase MoeB [Acidipila sp. EB88]RRA48543.1 molybdopterin-synthase adenylyltransferase MoeB [Acidipila sp. EB88]
MQIHIPTPLRAYTAQKSVVTVEAANVTAALDQLTQAHPELRRHLFGEDGKLRAFVNLYLNDEDVRYLPDREATAVHPGDALSIIPSIAGGAPSVVEAPQAELPELTTDDLQRYSRHLILPEVGIEGQRKLKAARVLCVGTGGLGAPLALYLAAAGVGTLGLVDFDTVDVSNLQRQIIHSTPDVGLLKVDSAANKLHALNPALNIVKHNTMLTSANALEIFRDYDIIADGTDNFQTRYLVNDACVLLNKPNAYGSIFRFEGQCSVFATKEGPCYRCLYPEPPPPGLVPSCAEGGVLGILPGLVGVLQATEVIKLILGVGEPLIGRLLLVDALTTKFRELKLRKSPDCPVCGPNPTVTELIDYNQFCGVAGAQESVTETVAKQGAALPQQNGVTQIPVTELKRRRDAGENPFVLDVREPWEYQIANIGGHLIPQGELATRLAEVPKDKLIVVQCKSGGRSQKAAELLQAQGYQVENLAGGITGWANEIDPKVAKY